MGLPPWATSSSQLFVLITGSNGGLGYSISERLISEFLTNPLRDIESHLVLIVTTRSEKKTRDTIVRLNKYLRLRAKATSALNGDNGRSLMKRVHLLGTEIDLCDIRGVYEAAARIKGAGVGDGNSLHNIAIPRLDVLIMNAGISCYYGFNYFRATWDMLTNLKQSVTWPEFNLTRIGVNAKPQRLLKITKGAEEQPTLGEVFLANVFGHYVFAHEVMNLLSTLSDRPSGERGRIIWLGSLDAEQDAFNLDDIQGLAAKDAYKSSKRLIDILALTSHLPGPQKANASFFEYPKPTGEMEAEGTPRKSKRIAANGNASTNGSVLGKMRRPEMYDAHPGICVTDIVSVPLWQRFLWTMMLYVARWLGSVWHPVTPAKGACAPVWTALVDQNVLDHMEGLEGSKKGKWGSCTDIWGEERVRRTEVEGWGWDGNLRAQIVGEEKKGRKYGAVALTKESRREFELQGARAWKEMEALRMEWEEILGLGGYGDSK